MKDQHLIAFLAAALLLICALYNYNPIGNHDINRNLRSNTNGYAKLAFNDPKSVATATADSQRAAIVASICAGVDHHARPASFQVQRVEQMFRTLMDGGSTLPRILLVSGFDYADYKHLVENKIVDRVVTISLDQLSFKIRQKGDGLTPTSNFVQERSDGTCTTLKLWAWDLEEFDVIYHTDADVKYFQSPDPYVEQFMDNSDLLFRAHCESRKRGWTGFNTHVMMFRPSRDIGKLLRLKAASGDFVAFTNTEQDVLESVFSPSTQCVIWKHGENIFFPSHRHG